MSTKDPWTFETDSWPNWELVQTVLEYEREKNKQNEHIQMNNQTKQNLEHDPVNKPAHYRAHPSGVECIQITEHMNFCLGNAVKYIWRAGLKTDDPIVDLEKARWYIDRELERLRTK